jgi:ABC-2 type transport system ATP-binding protein
MSIQVEHVRKAYGVQLALNDVSFTVGSGEIVGLIGPNGAGKSTLMKIICSLLKPTSGEVKINGSSVLQYPDEIKKHLGYLPENNPLYTDLYVMEYLQHVAGLYKPGGKIRDRVMEVIRLTGLDPEKHKKIGLLSKGYRQRVGLAQAIIHDPEILILDEPTTGLDPNQIAEIRVLISELGKEKTVILSTHIMQEVEAICKRVILLNKGQIIANDLTGNLGADSISHTLIIEFSTEIEENIFSSFPGIKRIKKITPGNWLIETGSEDIRGELFRFAVEHNLVILSMHRKDKKLEDVFRELTA